MYLTKMCIQTTYENDRLWFCETCENWPSLEREQELKESWYNQKLEIRDLEFKFPDGKLVEDSWQRCIFRLKHFKIHRLHLWNHNPTSPITNSPYFDTINLVIDMAKPQEEMWIVDGIVSEYNYKEDHLQLVSNLIKDCQGKCQTFSYSRTISAPRPLPGS